MWVLRRAHACGFALKTQPPSEIIDPQTCGVPAARDLPCYPAVNMTTIPRTRDTPPC
jgi:hypothetical protein